MDVIVDGKEYKNLAGFVDRTKQKIVAIDKVLKEMRLSLKPSDWDQLYEACKRHGYFEGEQA